MTSLFLQYTIYISRDDWEGYHPYSNVLWIHYIADKLLTGKSYKDTNSKQSRSDKRQLRMFYDEILQYNSASHMMLNSDYLLALINKLDDT